MPKIVKATVIRVILGVMSVLSLATAVEGSTPDHKSLIPPQVLTTSSSLVGTHDHATLDVAGNSLNHYIIQMDGERDQICGHTTATISTITTTATTISNNLTGPNTNGTSKTSEIITGTNSSLPTISTNSTESRTSEIIIDINSSFPTTNSSFPTTISTNSTETGSLNTETPTEGQVEKDTFQLRRTLLGLTFEAAVAWMVSRFQSQGNLSSPPSSSLSATLRPPPPPSPSSFPFAMVWATIVCGFTATLIGVILRKAHSTAANLCNYAGIFSVALGFILMMEMCVPERFVWSVWAAAGILVLASGYALARRSGKKGMKTRVVAIWIN